MEPIAEALGLPVTTDGRVIEAANYLEGLKVSVPRTAAQAPALVATSATSSARPGVSRYREIVARMRLAMKDAAAAAAGHEAVIVSHQLPIWMARCDAEGRRLFHDPRRRECTLASITSFTYVDGRVTSVSYREPAADLLRAAPGPEVRRGSLGSAAGAWDFDLTGAGGRRAAWRSLLIAARLRGERPPTSRSTAAASRAIRTSGRRLTQIPPAERRPAAGGHRAGAGQRRDAVQHRIPGQGRGAQRLGLLVRTVPGGGARPAGGQRADRGHRPVPRDQHQGPQRGPGRGVRPGQQAHLPEHLRPGRQGAAGVRRRPAAQRHPVDADHRPRRAGWPSGCSATISTITLVAHDQRRRERQRR